MPVSNCPPEHCADLIRSASRVVTLTGAGISTSAGVPDFRGPQGLYVTRRYDPEKVFEIGGFRREPRYFYEFSRDFVGLVRDVQPTFSHHFLARLDRLNKLAGVVTQNIDMLHQQAGSRKVIELHGSYYAARCLGCGRDCRELDYRWWETAMQLSSTPPVARCESCDGVLKPDIVFFGEMVKGFEAAEALVGGCDLLLVLGSSLQVAPASWLPHATDASIVVVNRGQVALPRSSGRYSVDSDLDDYFRKVADCLGMR